MRVLITNNLTGETEEVEIEEVEIEEVEGGQAPESVEPEQQVSTMEEVVIALMKMQAELEAATEALDFLIIGGM
jgi:hypothetical protein